MAGRQAKILSDCNINDLLVFASCTRNPKRNRVIVLLSVKAGLRAGELDQLTWDMILEPDGEVGWVIELHDRAENRGSAIHDALCQFTQTFATHWQRLGTSLTAWDQSSSPNATAQCLLSAS